MCKVLMEIMEPQLLQREREGKREGLKEATQVAVEVLRDIGREDTEIKTILVKNMILLLRRQRSI